MRSDFHAMLDACVLLPMPLADTLLRMAEAPRLFLPKWSDETLREITRSLQSKSHKTPEQAHRREQVMRAYFPESLVETNPDLLATMKNHPGDRHVLAAAVQSSTSLIVTYNQKHFPPSALAPYGIECQGPSTFLNNLYDLEPGIVAVKITEQAHNVGLSLEDLLRKLRTNVPGFVANFCEAQRIDL